MSQTIKDNEEELVHLIEELNEERKQELLSRLNVMLRMML